MFDLLLYYLLLVQIHVHWFSDAVDMNLSNLWEIVKDGEDWRTLVHGVTKSQTWLDD